MASNDPATVPHPLEYVRRLYANVLDWDRHVEFKAQMIFTIDGVFVSILAGSILGTLADAALVRQPQSPGGKELPLALVFAGLTTFCIGVSLVSAIRCLIPRLLASDEQEALHGRDRPSYGPNTMWFFQLVATLDRDEFVETTAMINPDFERRALAAQIHIISGRAVRKHRLVQRGFWSAVFGFGFFILTGISLALKV